MSANCPRCKTAQLRATEPGEFGFVTIDVCERCEGIWLDKGELDKLDDSVWNDAEKLAFEKPGINTEALACPRCADTRLEAIVAAGQRDLVLDRCPKCMGFWLDKGELERVRGVVGALDAADAQRTNITRRPSDWSFSRWLGYSIGRQLIHR